jgi:group II intron reverse transcriptase/maturase
LEKKESVMLEASKYLEIIRKRTEKGKNLERVHRLIRKKDILLQAYINLYANKGANTPGTDSDDVIDGMSLEKIKTLSEKLKIGKFKWKPVKRKYIPKKKNGQKRALGLPGWSEKLVQESMRIILEEYYEPKFSDNSHGFRRNRGCHTALKEIAEKKWTGVKWFIEGDIRTCFDNINHEKLLEILSRDIKDSRFLKLIRDMLQSGYMEEWKILPNYSGTQQGGVISPILSNIYLNELDKFIEEKLIPKYTKGKKRRNNIEYNRLNYLRKHARKKGNMRKAGEIIKSMRKLPSVDPYDPDFKRLRYVRYADDVLLGFIGSKEEAIKIKEEIANFLKNELQLELSMDKTLITNASKEKARFLNYEINAGVINHKQTKGINGIKRRSLNYKIQLRMPKDVLKSWTGKFKKNGKPIHRSEVVNSSDYDIVTQYDSELRGLYNYYKLAINVHQTNELKYYMLYSLAKTLAQKHKTSMKKICKKYKSGNAIRVIIPREGKNNLIASFGDIKLKRSRDLSSNHQEDEFKTTYNRRSELLQRILADKCELCGNEKHIEVHHIRKISDLKRRCEGKKVIPEWKKQMIARNRKTLVLCRDCHRSIHAGKYDGRKLIMTK